MKITRKEFELGDHIAKLAGSLNTCSNYFTDAYLNNTSKEFIRRDLGDILDLVEHINNELPHLRMISEKYGVKKYAITTKSFWSKEDFET